MPTGFGELLLPASHSVNFDLRSVRFHVPSNLSLSPADVPNQANELLCVFESAFPLFYDHDIHTEAYYDAHDPTAVFMTLTLTEVCTADPRESEDELVSQDEQVQATTRVDPREILLAAQV